MTTTRVLATALPYSLADDAPFHASVFFTHRLTPEREGAVLGDFPAAESWVRTLLAGELVLITDTAPDGVPVRFTSQPDPGNWSAVFPARTPVTGFSAPTVTGRPWRTYPAHDMDGYALEVHHASTTASWLRPPPVLGNPLAEAVLDAQQEFHGAIHELLSWPDRRARHAGQVLARALADARASLGQRDEHDTQPLPWTSAVELLLRDEDSDHRLTEYLDAMLEDGGRMGSSVLEAMRDVHAARRFYQREHQAYAREPKEGATAPRPEIPEHDFHQQCAQLGSTPVLLRPLGLVVDVGVDSADARQLLADATWVGARLTPAPGTDLVRLVGPRTRCESDGTHWRAVASGAWSGGALPLGDPDTYTVLDLDPDASALKLEQYLRDLPRALASELNGDPSSGAPASLRSTGFSIARRDRSEALRSQVQRAESFAVADDLDGSETGPDLTYDDVVRGLRLEVWDDVSQAWHSLHERRVTVTAGDRSVLDDAPDTGFLQLTGLTRAPEEDAPYHLHEVFVGWDGWSLSAPRPGKVIVHDEEAAAALPPDAPERHGSELVLDEPPDAAATHVHIRTRVAEGTLPWLRYGRRYSFRVRGVDLAGNSVPRPPTASAPDESLVSAARDQLELLTRTYAERDRRGLLAQVRPALLDRLPGGAPGEDTTLHLLDLLAEVGDDLSSAQDRLSREARLEAAPVRVPEEALTGVTEVDAVLRRWTDQEAEREVERGAGAGVLHQGIALALGRLARRQETWRVRPQLDLDPAVFAGLDDTRDPVRRPHRVRLPDGIRPVPPPSPGVPVVTTPRPFLRWHPVPPPTLVARRPLGTGESLQRLVVRAGVSSERHLVPPKATQLEVEQHGCLDEAIGSTDPATHDRWLAVALKERGTLLDTRIQDLDDPNGTHEQPEVALHSRPGADPTTAVTLEEVAEDRGTPLGEGQYVVHDVDQLVLPYLPDPLAAGVSLVFYDAHPPHVLSEPRVLQTVVLPYLGAWPEAQPLRLVIDPGEELGAWRDGNAVHVTVPAGEQVRVAVSSSMDERKLKVLGLWRSHFASAPGGEEAGEDATDEAARGLLARAAANGWFWWLTPAHDLRLVHAVPVPVRPPELRALQVMTRPPGLTVAALTGMVDLHGPSTDRFVLEASWTEWVDDLADEAPREVHRQDVVLSGAVGPRQRVGMLHLVDAVVGGQDGTASVTLYKAIQNFPDTGHRRVTYTPRGLTRYAEYFEPAELPAPDDPALAGQPWELTVRSSARPAAPEVRDVIPLLLWEEFTEPDQPFARRRSRRSGVRIWLERPWYSSGDGELLGVVLADGVPPDQSSRWGKDPVLATAVPPSTSGVPLINPAALILGEVEPGPGRPVTPPARLRLIDVERSPEAWVFGYRPEYHPGRRQWFVDVALDPGPSLWPFVRLAVARYQPDSLPEHELSPVVLCDWVQPLPERTMTVHRRAAETVQVTITGPVAFTRSGPRPAPDAPDAADALLRASREVFASVQRAPGHGGGDLDWTDEGRVRLPLAGDDGTRVTWSAELDLPEPVPVATPGRSERWRVLVEEYEYFDADPTEGPKTGRPGTERRLVYADQLAL